MNKIYTCFQHLNAELTIVFCVFCGQKGDFQFYASLEIPNLLRYNWYLLSMLFNFHLYLSVTLVQLSRVFIKYNSIWLD